MEFLMTATAVVHDNSPLEKSELPTRLAWTAFISICCQQQHLRQWPVI